MIKEVIRESMKTRIAGYREYAISAALIRTDRPVPSDVEDEWREDYVVDCVTDDVATIALTWTHGALPGPLLLAHAWEHYILTLTEVWA